MNYTYNRTQQQRQDQSRLQLYYRLIYVFILVLILRLLYIEIFMREKFELLAEKQYLQEVRLDPVRGGIFDRRMRPLAINVPSVSIGAYPLRISNTGATARKLSRVLGISSSTLQAKLRKDRTFGYLVRRASRQTGLEVEALGLEGISIIKEYARQYPLGEVGSQILGFMDADGHGISGVEKRYESVLYGVPGYAVKQKTAVGNQFTFYHPDYPMQEAEPGGHIVLTIDASYQGIAHRELRRTLQETSADSGVAIIMDPKTAEILAMASEPGFNPNAYGKYSPSSYRLRAITDQFEAGSTFKLVTMAGLLNEGIYSPNDKIFCENGEWTVMGETIHDVHPYGMLTMHDIIAKSSNIGMAKSIRDKDKSLVYRYARDFGFGARTGVGLDGEASGQLRDMAQWSGFTPYAMAFGHEIAVTPLQMANMFCTIANGGTLLTPYIVREVQDAEGHIRERNLPKAIRRVISTETAEMLKAMMADVVKEGTAKKAQLEGLTVCGKTGTARMVRSGGGGYIKGQYIANFGGFFPKDQPEVVIYVMIDNPKGSYLGGDVAAPCFRRIAQQILYQRGVDVEAEEGEELDLKFVKQDRRIVPSFIGFNRAAAVQMAGDLNLELDITGRQGVVVEQTPKAGAEILIPATIRLVCRDDSGEEARHLVPRVTGLPIRNALNVLAAEGITAVVSGSGKVISQQPPPGRHAKPGDQVLLVCESSIDLRKLLIF
ncbi:MAG TPA: penicillin-binding transpeptidase domain-containing protein [bacterium]|nr:penicillin-binding transpeptidase domain-containing protein [bacterium]HQI48278.1 penicillin-binding transpeptidase domain-containing protein [bacterium]HQJ64894.1 penicillin-binding transpeptidase domain-containing protein [bacterium]